MMENRYLFNGTLRLRACEPEDLEVMYRIENDSSLWEAGLTTTPYSRYALKQYIASSQNDIFIDRQLRLMVVRCEDGLAVGITDLTDFDPLHRRAGVGMVILPEYRRRGYARQALDLLCRYAYDYLHLHQLYAYIACDNAASLNLFEDGQFVRSGILREWLQADGGRFKDVHLLQRIRK